MRVMRNQMEDSLRLSNLLFELLFGLLLCFGNLKGPVKTQELKCAGTHTAMPTPQSNQQTEEVSLQAHVAELLLNVGR